MEEKVPTISGAGDMEMIRPGKLVQVIGVWTGASPASLTIRDHTGEVNFICGDKFARPTLDLNGLWTLQIINEMKPTGYFTVRVVKGEKVPEPKKPSYFGRTATRIDRGGTVHT